MLAFVLAAFSLLLAAGFVYEQLARRSDEVQLPPAGELIDVGGRRLHLLSKGTGAPTVVIEQGAGGPSLTWLSVQDKVAEFARVCLYDRAGYRWSDSVPGQRSLEDRVKDLHELLMRAAVPAPYVLVAHSYGGFLVRLFAKQYAEKVAGLVLVDTPDEQGYCRNEVLSLYNKFSWMMRAMSLMALFGVPRLVTRLIAKPDPNVPPLVSKQLNAAMVRHEYFASASDDLNSVKRAMGWLVKPEALSQLGDLPLAVISHGQPFPGPFAVLEKCWREGQERLAGLSTNSSFVVAERANHMIHNDQPDVVVDAIRSVVERTRRA